VLKNRENYEIIDPTDVGIYESSIVLTARSGRAALKHHIENLGFKLDKTRLDEVYQEFLKLADKKKDIKEDDLLMLLGELRGEKHRIKLDFLQVLSGKEVHPMATVSLIIAGEKFSATSDGNGPVDAAIKAVKQILTRHVTVEEFLIQAITRGSDDVGKVHMTISHDDRHYHGFGAHTDIITASVEAFLDGINKIPVVNK
jgi:2-isopropylmalate synthase